MKKIRRRPASSCSEPDKAAGNTGGTQVYKMKDEKTKLQILFIGNSHTYFNDMPLTVRQRAAEEGFDCRVIMLSHGGWYLAQHVREPDVRFNLLYGGNDYVVLQEFAHPFGPFEKYRDAAAALNDMLRRGGSIPVIYGTWARKSEPEIQETMNEAHRAVAAEIGALLAPVGEIWRDHMKSHPDTDLYWSDGAHASPAGSALAAGCIWETIREDVVHRQNG